MSINKIVSTITVRLAITSDIPAIQSLNQELQDLHHEAVPEHFKPSDCAKFPAHELEYALSDPFQLLWIAEIEGACAGYALCFIRPKENTWNTFGQGHLVLNHITVARALKRRGVGTALVRSAENHASDLALGGLALDFWSFNADAEKFYQSIGFEVRRKFMWKRI
jgi:diamine N-acetyltransferase